MVVGKIDVGLCVSAPKYGQQMASYWFPFVAENRQRVCQRTERSTGVVDTAVVRQATAACAPSRFESFLQGLDTMIPSIQPYCADQP